MTYTKLFLSTVTVTTSILVALIFIGRPKERLLLTRLTGEVFLTSQLEVEDIRSLRRQKVNTIVDLRPDGEAKDQASSADISSASELRGIKFGYIPVPHESIPDEAVEALGRVLSEEPTPVLLYCRTGRRAARTFALVEASQASGPNMAAILQMVKQAGFSADDLKENMARRISQRGKKEALEPPEH